MTRFRTALARLRIALPPLACGAFLGAPLVRWGATGDPVDGIAIAATFVLVSIGCRMSIQAPSKAGDPTTWTLMSAMQFASLMVFGPWVVIPASVAAVLLHCRLAGRPVVACFGNAAIAGTAQVVAAAAFSGLGGSFGHIQLPGDYAPFALGAMAFAVAAELLVAADSCAEQVSEGASVGLVLRNEADGLREYLPASLLETLVGMSLGMVYLLGAWATLVLLAPIASLYLAMRRGVRVAHVTEAALETFANIVDERDRYTFEHSSRVTEYAVMIGRELDFTETQMKSLYWTARLHDLGKIAVENAILNKPGPLDDAEFAVMRTHPVVSARILESFAFDERAADAVRCHHERFDGRGYLRRAAETVPLDAFVIAVADSYDAMTSDRPYRQGMPRERALDEIRANIGTQFHPECARAFLRVMDRRDDLAPGDEQVELDELRDVA
ncbi:MAG: metal dependent phosphohydrolase [Thermoleophilia bacterium]|nr:metal dependent phosphohydrolase [Thermoleophilia bacterium]